MLKTFTYIMVGVVIGFLVSANIIIAALPDSLEERMYRSYEEVDNKVAVRVKFVQ